jgi:hypothetical protein
MTSATQTLFEQKISSAQMMMQLGRDIAGRAANGAPIDVEEIYDEWAQMRGELQTVASRAAQISKLRVFERFGKRYRAGGASWLNKWVPHQRQKLSVYETLLHEMRQMLG